MAKYQKYAEYKNSGIEWLGEIPSHWDLFSLKRAVDGCTNGFWGSEPDGNNDLCVLRVADFNRHNFTIGLDKLTYRSVSQKEAENRLLQKGDLLLEKSGGGEKTLVGCVVQFNEDFQAITSNFVAKMTPQKHMVSRFLTYAFSHLYAGRVNFPSIKQTTGIQNLDSEAYLIEKFVFPNKDEQTQIANFLDHETAKIDSLITKQEKLIELLKEKRQAVISHAVTKGLNPDVNMKDSGVEWLRQVPEHWTVITLKYLVTAPIIDGPHVSPIKRDEGVPFISAEAISSGKIDFEKKWGFISKEDHKLFSKRYVPKYGDLLIVKLGATTGSVAMVETHDEFNIWVPLATVRVSQKRLNSKFMYYLFQSLQIKDAIQQSWTFGTQQTLGLGTISNFRIPLPTLEESHQIVKYLDEKLSRFEDIITQAEDSLNLLKERRTALISSAVTGKIDVRNWQNPNHNNNETNTELGA